MKKAAYYARVSTSLQEEQGTIESQKTELKKQILADGNILVKEYIDEGWSGGLLDRPALDELRADLKSDLFEVVYFLDSDRIARDVSYQNIIITELLKYEKEIIIKGKNYVHNPENKFTLTILGAVNELEKAKITERLMRGRREKARRGAIMHSSRPYGYNHILRTDQQYGRFEINEKEAATVRMLFETYATTNISLSGLIRLLEEKGVKTNKGKPHWFRDSVRYILTNPTYYGEHFFGRTEKIEPPDVKAKSETGKYLKSVKTKTRIRDRDEWITIPVPPIISRELFEAVQERLKRNKKLLRNPHSRYLLSGLIVCGDCGHIYSGVTTKFKQYYRCNFRDKQYAHAIEFGDEQCLNGSIVAKEIEPAVLKVVENQILQPSVIKKYIDILNQKAEDQFRALETDLAKIPKRIADIEAQKKRILDLYAEGLIEKTEYVKKINEIDSENSELVAKDKKAKETLMLAKEGKKLELSIDEYLVRAKKNYYEADKEQKIFILRTLIKNVVLHKNDTESKFVITGILPIDWGPEVRYCNTSINSVALYHSTTSEFLFSAQGGSA